MMPNQSRALRVGLAALLALVLLQLIWHWPDAEAGTNGWLLLAVTVIPLLPGLWAALGNLRRGVLIGGICCLLYFCHAVVVAWAESAERIPALIELALTLVVIASLGWDARHYRRRKSPAG